jgi:hypothetical protein
MWPLLIVMLGSGESRIVLLFGLGNFILSHHLPFINGMWNLVSVKGFTVNHFVQAFSEANNGSFSIKGPSGS